MKDVILYDRIEKKNQIEADIWKPLSPAESLELTLNLMDFVSALSKNRNRASDNVDWIVLELKK
jgi:hypothetical protein